VTVSATSPPFEIYRWPNDSSGNQPVKVFSGDPAAAVAPNLGYADAIAVRGAGPDTQILVAPRAGTNVILLRSSSGLDFQTEIPPAVIAVSGVPLAFAQLGIAFGRGTNTLWGKNVNNQLSSSIRSRLNTGLLYAYPTNRCRSSRDFGTGIRNSWLALHRYFGECSPLTFQSGGGPVLETRKSSRREPQRYRRWHGRGVRRQLSLRPRLQQRPQGLPHQRNQSLSPFDLSVTPGGGFAFTWQSVAGTTIRSVQIPFERELVQPRQPITAAALASFTNTTLDTFSKFYRIQGQ
jgi:hypothetical protein